jgi:hypothetical protein
MPESFETQAAQKRPSAAAEFLRFIFRNKKWWLTPILILLVLIGILVVLGGTGIAPFIYTLF